YGNHLLEMPDSYQIAWLARRPVKHRVLAADRMTRFLGLQAMSIQADLGVRCWRGRQVRPARFRSPRACSRGGLRAPRPEPVRRSAGGRRCSAGEADLAGW